MDAAFDRSIHFFVSMRQMHFRRFYSSSTAEQAEKAGVRHAQH